MGWTEIHDAVQQAMVTASGLPTGRVIWKYQNANAPTQSYVAMRFSVARTVGYDYKQYDYDALRPIAQEVRARVRGTREVVLEVECFTDSTADSQSAWALAELVKSALLLDSVRGKMAEVELTPFDPGEVNYVPDVPNTTFRGRATLSIRCYVPATAAEEFFSYIDNISGEITAEGSRTSPIVTPYTAPE